MAAVTLQIASDLHLDHRPPDFPPFDSLIVPSARVLALIGDIGGPDRDDWLRLLTWASARFELVLVVLGNHDLWSKSGETMQDLRAAYRSLCRQHANVYLLDRNTCEFDGQVMFIGTTLWTHIPPANEDDVMRTIGDFRYIWMPVLASDGVTVVGKRNVHAADLRAEFDASLQFIQAQCASANAKGLKPVVLTHHIPSAFKTSHPKFEGNSCNCAFATKIEDSERRMGIRLWASGHSHFNYHHAHEGYELISNQYGYASTPVASYDPRMSI
ncbi:hypothetical protein HK101_001853, partial [Irineochytrium annulatum]